MSDVWRKQFEAEMQRLSGSKGRASLGTFEESAALKEEVVSKSLEDRIEVPAESPEKVTNQGEESKSPWVLVANLANRMKRTMVEIRALTESSQVGFKDRAFGHEFHRRMTDHIDNSETDLNCFLDYLRIKSATRQTNVVQVILEEVLEKNRKKLTDKGIKIFRKQFEKDLPEVSVHFEELRFILNWLLEYAIMSAVPNRDIGFLTKSLEVQGGKDEISCLQQIGTKCIQILILLEDYDKSKQIGVPPKINTAHTEGESSCILPFVDEIVRKNRGLLKLSPDSEGRLRIISLILPIERRKLVYYQQAQA